MNMNRILTAKSAALVLTAAISGAVLGFYFGPRVAQAASAPQVVAFDRVINGKLDVFSPGVSYKLITTQNGADFAANVYLSGTGCGCWAGGSRSGDRDGDTGEDHREDLPAGRQRGAARRPAGI